MADWTPERIKALRQRMGLSQRAFAERAHVSSITVARWESGKFPLTQWHIAEYLEQLEREAQTHEKGYTE